MDTESYDLKREINIESKEVIFAHDLIIKHSALMDPGDPGYLLNKLRLATVNFYMDDIK